MADSVPKNAAEATNQKGQGNKSPFQDSDVDDYDPPSAKFINWFLTNADSRAVGSLLHPIGFTDGSVASGEHTHDGKNSLYLFSSTPVIQDLIATASTAEIIAAVNALTDHLISRGAGVSNS